MTSLHPKKRSGAKKRDEDGVRIPAIAGVVGAPRDPIGHMHPTAQRMIDGARHVLLTRGFDALTLSSIAEASGTNRALVKYHFGNKEGLIEVLVDSIVHDESVDLTALLESVPPSQRLSQFVRSVDEISNARESFRVFYDVLPHVLRDDDLRERMSRLYDWYVDVKLVWLGVDPRRHPEHAREIVGLGELMVAVVDGLALQRLIRDESFDASRALEMLELLLSESWTHFAPLHESESNPWKVSGD